MADIFACGVILFTLVQGGIPFIDAIQSDYHYKTLALNQASKFWGIHEKSGI